MKLTPEQEVDLLCGIKLELHVFGQKLSLPFELPRSFLFTPACSIHDIEFLKKEAGLSTQSRNLTDTQFLKAMLAMAATKSRIERLYLVPLAYSLYALARAGGRPAWSSLF